MKLRKLISLGIILIYKKARIRKYPIRASVKLIILSETDTNTTGKHAIVGFCIIEMKCQNTKLNSKSGI